MYPLYAVLINNQTVTGSGWDGVYIALTDRGREVNDFQWDGWPDLFEWNLDWAQGNGRIFVSNVVPKCLDSGVCSSAKRCL